MSIRVVHFVSGPKNGEAISIREGTYEVVIDEFPEILGYQTNEVVKPRKGYYTRIGNLLVWEGWGK